MTTETTTRPTVEGWYWARRDGDLDGEVILVSRHLGDGELVALCAGEGEPESLRAFFLFYGPIESPIAVPLSRGTST